MCNAQLLAVQKAGFFIIPRFKKNLLLLFPECPVCGTISFRQQKPVMLPADKHKRLQNCPDNRIAHQSGCFCGRKFRPVFHGFFHQPFCPYMLFFQIFTCGFYFLYIYVFFQPCRIGFQHFSIFAAQHLTLSGPIHMQADFHIFHTMPVHQRHKFFCQPAFHI